MWHTFVWLLIVRALFTDGLLVGIWLFCLGAWLLQLYVPLRDIRVRAHAARPLNVRNKQDRSYIWNMDTFSCLLLPLDLLSCLVLPFLSYVYTLGLPPIPRLGVGPFSFFIFLVFYFFTLTHTHTIPIDASWLIRCDMRRVTMDPHALVIILGTKRSSSRQKGQSDDEANQQQHQHSFLFTLQHTCGGQKGHDRHTYTHIHTHTMCLPHFPPASVLPILFI